MSGAVIGINSSIRTTSSSSPSDGGAGSIGLGFAIPIGPVMPLAEQMEAGEAPTHARLGIRISDSTDAETQGAQVREVTAGSTAADAGLEAGDVVTGLGTHHISGADSLVATVRSYRPGDTVELRWSRDGEEHTATVELDSDATSD
jgi:putative serine protease PepD